MKLLLGLICLAALVPAANASRTVTDELGHSVTVPDHPHRIICLTPNIIDTVFALGAADDVIARTDFVEYPAIAKQKQSVGSIMTPSFEMILSLHPDLVLAMPHANPQTTLDQIQRHGIPLYLVDPHGISGIFRSITDLGDALNRGPQASEVVARLQRRVSAVQTRVKGKPVVSVYMPIAYEPNLTIGKGSFITEIIQAAGGHSITADIDQEWPEISMETVIARAPQALLLFDDAEFTIDILQKRPGWSVLPAVRNRRVYTVDKRIDFPSPIAIEALEDLAREFHP
jgi:ABC-type Fe3+-hydroxamate transport system substrate-binding protein